jgi:hypothetical protein
MQMHDNNEWAKSYKDEAENGDNDRQDPFPDEDPPPAFMARNAIHFCSNQYGHSNLEGGDERMRP